MPKSCHSACAGGSLSRVAWGRVMSATRLNLAAYDEAFGKFLCPPGKGWDHQEEHALCHYFLADENDHFAGGAPFNQGCDGVKVPCVYTMGNQTVIGEFTTNMTEAVARPMNRPAEVMTGFDISRSTCRRHFTWSGQPAPGDSLARQFEKSRGRCGLTAVNLDHREPRTNSWSQWLIP